MFTRFFFIFNKLFAQNSHGLFFFHNQILHSFFLHCFQTKLKFHEFTINCNLAPAALAADVGLNFFFVCSKKTRKKNWTPWTIFFEFLICFSWCGGLQYHIWCQSYNKSENDKRWNAWAQISLSNWGARIWGHQKRAASIDTIWEVTRFFIFRVTRVNFFTNFYFDPHVFFLLKKKNSYAV